VPARTRNVFIVEDDQLLARALSVQVEMLGYPVLGSADTADKAIARILAIEPDIVIMDVNLGAGGSGLDVARSVRLQSDVPIIFHTAYSDTAFREQVARLEKALVLEKPVPEETLNDALSAATLLRQPASNRHFPGPAIGP
jgi:DNA-binding NarL/FixJ family response regulator